ASPSLHAVPTRRSCDLHFHLYLLGEGGGKALQIKLFGIESHGLQKELVAGLVGKADHLILDGGAVTGTHTLDDAGEKGRTVQIRSEEHTSEHPSRFDLG